MPGLNVINKAARFVGKWAQNAGRTIDFNYTASPGASRAAVIKGQIANKLGKGMMGIGRGLRAGPGIASWGQIGMWGGSALGGGIAGSAAAGPGSRGRGFIGGAAAGLGAVVGGRGAHTILTRGGIAAARSMNTIKRGAGASKMRAFGSSAHFFGRTGGYQIAAGYGATLLGTGATFRGRQTNNIPINYNAPYPIRARDGRYATLPSNRIPA